MKHMACVVVLAATCAPSGRASGPRYPPSHPLVPLHRDKPASSPPRVDTSGGGSAEDPSGHERWEAWAGEIAAAAGAAKRAQRGQAGAFSSAYSHQRRRRAQEDDGGDAPLEGEEVPGEQHDAAAFAADEAPPANGGGGASQRLRAHLLSNYDRGSFPWEKAWEANAAADGDNSTNTDGTLRRRGLEIELGINFHRVFAVDVERSTSALVVWLRQSWTDPRLAWNPADYANITSAHFWVGQGSGPGGETSEIWTPDLELWNMEVGLADSLSDAPALVSHTGSVFWSRPGHLMPVCKFKGLDDFPFDRLLCTVEIGSWSHSGLYIRPVLMGEGFSIGGSETAGESYAEFKLGHVGAREVVYPPYPAAPEEDWPVVMYDITFSRSWQPYVRGYLVLQIILNLAAFACFWMPPQCGERMGLAITALLAAVTSELVVSANLPTAAELTWFARFSLTSLGFASASLFESAAVIYFFYLTSADLVPRWVKWLISQWKQLRSSKMQPGNVPSNETEDVEEKGEKEFSSMQTEGRVLASIDESSFEATGKGSLDDTWRENESKLPGGSQNEESSPSVRLNIGSSDDNIECEKHAQENEVTVQDTSDSSNDSSSSVGSQKGISSFANSTSSGAQHMAHYLAKLGGKPNISTRIQSKPKRKPKLSQAQSAVLSDWKEPVYTSPAVPSNPRRSRLSSGSQRFNLRDWGSGQHSFARDADDFKDSAEVENNKRWQKVAKGLDDASRVIFPLAYALALAVLLGQNR